MDTNYLLFVALMIVGIIGVAFWASWYDNKHKVSEE